jgi:hypothetical protein
MLPLEFYTHMCFHVMHIGLLQLHNDLWKTLWMYVIKFYNIWCQLLSTFWYNSQCTTKLWLQLC